MGGLVDLTNYFNKNHKNKRPENIHSTDAYLSYGYCTMAASVIHNYFYFTCN